MLMIVPISCIAKNPVEAGKVTWGRELEPSLTSSAQTGKPVFALFQEIPGCTGCQQFGRDVLSNTLIVAAIESEFTPLLIHNNKPGVDAAVLARFGEPAWNYQVVRFLDENAKDIIPRKDRVWDTGPLAERMVATLIKAKRQVPAYLSLLASEHSPALKQVAFAMHCFWTGEMALGQIDGVVTTEAGFMGGHEVTLVNYDPEQITLPNLVAAAEKVRCANAVYVAKNELDKAHAARLKVGVLAGYEAAPADDQKKQISGTAVAPLALVGAQATKVNAWVRADIAKALSYLTPAQRAQLR